MIEEVLLGKIALKMLTPLFSPFLPRHIEHTEVDRSFDMIAGTGIPSSHVVCTPSHFAYRESFSDGSDECLYFSRELKRLTPNRTRD
jgi:hypothetical protein